MKMLWANSDVNQEHQYSSSALEWPTMNRGVAYWISPDSNVSLSGTSLRYISSNVKWGLLLPAVYCFHEFIS